MPTTRAADAKQQRMLTQRVTALPEPLLEMILVQSTTANDQKALRQTCKSFQQTLDNSLICIGLRATDLQSRQCVRNLLERMQHLQRLRAIAITAHQCNVDSLFGILPRHIKSLRIEGTNIDLQRLVKLPCLTCLSVDDSRYSTGLQLITGLTYLQCNTRNGSLSHLAPTLKHLSIRDYWQVPDVLHLTNLTVLEVAWALPLRFFEMNRNLPIRHMRISPYNEQFSNDFKMLESAPTTLTRLTLKCACDIPTDVQMPRSITHLQLERAQITSTKQIAAALPWLQTLDVCLHEYSYEVLCSWGSAFAHLSNLTKLSSLGICVKQYAGSSILYQRRTQILSALPDVQQAGERGVKLHVMENEDEWLDVFGYRCDEKSVWATHC